MPSSDRPSGPSGCQKAAPEYVSDPDPAERNLVQKLIQGLDRPEERIERVAVGRFFVGVLAGGRLGLASTLGAGIRPPDRPVIESLPGSSLASAAKNMFAGSPLTVSLGLAALNAALVPPHDRPGPNAEDLIADWGRNKKVVVVGHFPFTQRLGEIASRLDLLELKDVPGQTARGEWARVLSGCDVAAVTSTALLTRRMSYFLGLSKQAKRILVGPSTPLSPVLYKEGVDVLAGSLVLDPESVLAGIEADGTFRELKNLGIRFVCLRPEDFGY